VDTIAEIVQGLKMGNLLRFTFDWTFNPQLMAKLLTTTAIPSFAQLR